MPPPHDELPMESGEPRDSGCAGCPGCGLTQFDEDPGVPPPDDSETSIGKTLLAPIGLFLLPVVTSMLGAMWGNVAAFGELLGGLAGLAFGMGVAVFTTRILGRRTRSRDEQEPTHAAPRSD